MQNRQWCDIYLMLCVWEFVELNVQRNKRLVTLTV
jgi:hypothetical protein